MTGRAWPGTGFFRSALRRPTSLRDRRLPLLVGGLVVALALPTFLLAGWRLSGWALGAGLWAGAQLVVAGLASLHASRLVGFGVVAVALAFRGIVVATILLAVAASDPSLALAGAVVYAAAYGFELTLTLPLYF